MCAIRTDNSVACWGTYDRGSQVTQTGDFETISPPDYVRITAPEGRFTSVSAGRDHICGVRTDGSVACWGDDSFGKATPPQGGFVSVGAGWHHTCGVRTDRSVACWGSNVLSPGSGVGPPP